MQHLSLHRRSLCRERGLKPAALADTVLSSRRSLCRERGLKPVERHQEVEEAPSLPM